MSVMVVERVRQWLPSTYSMSPTLQFSLLKVCREQDRRPVTLKQRQMPLDAEVNGISDEKWKNTESQNHHGASICRSVSSVSVSADVKRAADVILHHRC